MLSDIGAVQGQSSEDDDDDDESGGSSSDAVAATGAAAAAPESPATISIGVPPPYPPQFASAIAEAHQLVKQYYKVWPDSRVACLLFAVCLCFDWFLIGVFVAKAIPGAKVASVVA